MHMITRCLIAGAVALLALPPAVANEGAAWDALSQPGHAILMRHANAPGTGDPDAFTLGDCSTQRNLDNSGREQARQTGRRLRERGVEGQTVYTSRWCRCTETAELLGLGTVKPLDGLNSFFGDEYTKAHIMPQLRAFLRGTALDPPPVLVTHQVNITALTGVFAREGELVVIEVADDGNINVVGRIRPDD